MNPVKVIIDTDIGDDIDDVLALGYALRRPELDILGVTTVWGDVDTRAKMVKQLFETAGRPDIPVYAGCDETLCASVPVRGHINHAVGDLSPYRYDTSVHGVDFIINTVMAGDHDVTLVGIGALTNIAMAMIKCPAIKKKVKRIVWMGGAFYYHFLTWNAVCDPDAVRVVFESGVPLTVVSRDVCIQCKMPVEETEKIMVSEDPVNRLIAEEIKLFRIRGQREPILFDPLTITAVFDESLLTFKEERVLVETKGEFTRGMTLTVNSAFASFFPIQNYPKYEDIPICRVANTVKVNEYIQHYVQTMLTMPIIGG